MNKIVFIISLLLFNSCNSQKSEKEGVIEKETSISQIEIQKIVFSEVATSIPLNESSYKNELIVFTSDSIKLINENYREGKLTREKGNSYYNPNKKFFSKIPEKYLQTNNYSSLNYIPENDGEKIVLLIYTNKSMIRWSLSYNENDLPDDLRFIIKEYIGSKRRLKI